MSKKGLKLEPLAIGGVAMGNGFEEVSDKRAQETLEAAWKNGIRQYDTSPWYGLGLSERRFGHFLHNKKRDEYILSSKVGRLLKPSKDVPDTQWVHPAHFDYEYDYSAGGVRRSIEDSLERLGVERLDYVFIHDLSPDNGDLDNWLDYYKTAVQGAMPELSKMRDEGIIKGWGLGVNTIEPILKTLEDADPDLFLSAIQYSMVRHEDSLDRLFPAIKKSDASLIVAAPFNAGLLAGQGRFNYMGKMPEDIKSRYENILKVAKKHDVDLVEASIRFSSAPECVDTLLLGASHPDEIVQDINAMDAQIPAEFWQELKEKNLIDERAETPA